MAATAVAGDRVVEVVAVAVVATLVPVGAVVATPALAAAMARTADFSLAGTPAIAYVIRIILAAGPVAARAVDLGATMAPAVDPGARMVPMVPAAARTAGEDPTTAGGPAAVRVVDPAVGRVAVLFTRHLYTAAPSRSTQCRCKKVP
jgi:hypothetical protein